MNGIAELVHAAGINPNRDYIRQLNQQARQDGLLGLPLVFETEETVPTYIQIPNTWDVQPTEDTRAGILLGSFNGIHLGKAMVADESGIQNEDRAIALLQDPFRQNYLYAFDLTRIIGDQIRLSDVSADLRDDPLALEIESTLTEASVDLFALAACYRRLSGRSNFEVAQFSAHAQHNIDVGRICQSALARHQIITKSSEGYHTYDQHVSSDVSKDAIPFVIKFDGETALSFVDVIFEDEAHEPIYEKTTVLDRGFTSYCRPARRILPA